MIWPARPGPGFLGQGGLPMARYFQLFLPSTLVMTHHVARKKEKGLISKKEKKTRAKGLSPGSTEEIGQATQAAASTRPVWRDSGCLNW
jgi:hypothetical protein